MLEIYLALNKIPVLSIFPCLPNQEVVDVVNRLKPDILGVSIALPFHLTEVEKLHKVFHDQNKQGNTRVFVGGVPLRKHTRLISNTSFEVCNDFREFHKICTEIGVYDEPRGITQEAEPSKAAAS